MRTWWRRSSTKKSLKRLTPLTEIGIQRFIGGLALAFPIVLLLVVSARDLEVPHSLSAYYYTPARPVFVAFLIAIGTLLIIYRGNRTETVLSTICGISVICLALIPTKVCLAPTDCFESTTLFASRWLHYPAATTFFIGAALHSRFLFSRTVNERLSTVFRRLGDFLLLLVALLAVLVVTKWSKGTPFIFYLQALMVWLFALSWILKGFVENPKEFDHNTEERCVV